MQIENTLHIAIHNDYNIIIPVNAFLNTTYVVINKSVTPEHEKITDNKNFIHRSNLNDFDKTCFTKNTEKVMCIMKDIFVFKDVNPLGANDLVIHIRSGDIFTTRNKSVEMYVPPPLSYYKNIIENHKFDNMYIIAEDTHNPCINQLIELYPTIKFRLQTLEEDIILVLATPNIVISIGTFIPKLLMFSNNIKKVYSTSYNWFNSPDFIITDLKEYHTKMRPWKNTPEQQEILLNYKSPKT